MKKRLTAEETISISSMLFGMFFGAGNLIFPVFMGQHAGRNIWQALFGFLITGVGLPLFGVAALGISKSNGLFELSAKVGKKYALFFTCLLYLTIGPLFAIPRCATVSYTVGIVPIIFPKSFLPLLIFTFLFFAVVLMFSLKPSGIMTWIGNILNPIFLLCLGILVVKALISPMGSISEISPQSAYESYPFFNGFIEGYNTMDALAGLAFGIVVVNVIKNLGVKEPGDIAHNTVVAGVLSCLIMAVIYVLVAIMGAQSRNVYDAYKNGGDALNSIACHYFGKWGNIVLALTVTFACLKTAIGLVTSCAESFEEMFKGKLSYRTWAVIFCVFSFLTANLGLDLIIRFSLPVLMFLYPLAITIILLALFGKFYNNDKTVYGFVTAFTLFAAIFDFLNALPDTVKSILHLEKVIGFASRFFPMFDLGLGWICPAVVGFIIGFVIYKSKRRC